MRNSFATSALVLALLIAAVAADGLPLSPASAATSNSCTSQTDPFSVSGTTWGTPASPLSAYPGALDIPLTITFLFSGPCTSPQATIYLGFTQEGAQIPFVGIDGNPEPSVVALNVSPNTLVTETFYLNIDPTAQTGLTYHIPLIVVYSNNTVADQITQTTLTAGGPLTASVPLYGQVQLAYTSATTRLLGGSTDNVTLTISNTGQGTAGPISTTVAAPSGVTVLNQLSTTPSLLPGSNSTQVLELFVGSSLSGTAFVLTFSAKYLDQYSNSQTSTQTLGFSVISSTSAGSSAFVVQGARWSNASSSSSPLPGTQDTALVVSLQYLGAVPVNSLQGTLTLPAGFTDLNGGSSAVAYSAATTGQYGSVTLTFYLDLASTVAPGNYNFSLSLQWMTSQASGLTQTAVLTPPPVASLSSSFQVQGAAWGSSSSSATSPVPGAQGEPLVVTLQYLGTTSVSNIQGTLTLPAGFTDLNGGSTATAFAAAATPNQVVALTFYVDVASGVKPGSYSFPMSLSWLTSVSVTVTQSGTVAPPPVEAPTSSTSFDLVMTQLNSTVVDGSTAAVGFRLTNDGSSPVYSPTFSLTAISPVVLTSQGLPTPASELAPGANATYVASVTSGPSGTPGIYSASLSVSFTDSSGTTHTQTFPVSFTVEGTVILVLQDTAVSQSLTGFTVTGSILNEGSVAAYYSSIGGVLGTSSATPTYLGEIDPNTPLPFSVTIPFTAPAFASTNASSPFRLNGTTVSTSRSFSRSFNFSRIPGGNISFVGGFPGLNGSSSAGATVQIALSLTYKDTFGDSKIQAFTVPASVKTASQLAGTTLTGLSGNGSSGGNSGPRYIAYGVVVVLVVALAGGALMLRRHRTKALAKVPPEQRAEQSVI